MEKIARLCWNTFDWKRPSGRNGKSQSDSSYETSKGFGHEEWLLDDSRIYKPDGYHYGFLQQLNLKTDRHVGQTYDIHLFTISPLGQKVYVGCLHDAVCISPEESKKIYKYYKEKGWIKSMEEDILYAGGTIADMKPEWLFNVKFKFSEADLKSSNKPIIAPESFKGHRYNLMDKTEDFLFEKDEGGHIRVLNTSSFVRTTEGNTIIVDPLHKKIQNAVARLIGDQYDNLVFEESPRKTKTKGQRVDIMGVSKETGETHYFEIKTVSAKRSIREALGQILEYAHYPNNARAARLFIVGPQKPDQEDLKYMRKLRKNYHLPIWFRWYSFEKDALFDEEQIVF